jgi:hypothetical protein
MKNQLTHKMLEADIRNAKSNIHDPKSIDKLRENIRTSGRGKNVEVHTLTLEERKHADETHRLNKLAHYLIGVSEASEMTASLKKALAIHDAKKTKMYLYRLTQGIKALSVRTEDDEEILASLEKEFSPLLATLEKEQQHRHLHSHIQRLHSIVHEKLDPQKWKHAA